jgi:alcohol dehydrogenase
VTTEARALVLDGARQLTARAVPLPETGDDDALLRIEACGLCGTDHEQYTGALPGPGAFVPGHESVGVLERVGPAARERWGLGDGDRVALAVFQSCGACDACLAGDDRGCRKHGLRDSYGFMPLDRDPGLWGGYASHQYLAPDSVLIPVPEGLDPAVATLFNPLGAGIRWGVTLPGTKPGDVVVVLGPGIRGLSVAAAARDAGAATVLVTGFGSRDHDRLERAHDFGADVTVDVSVDDPVAALREATGGRLADIVLDVTAKAPAALAQSISLARHGGTIVLAGTRGSGETPGFWPDLIVFRELRILGALGVDGASYRAAMDLLASGRYPFADLPRRTAGFDDIEDLLLTMAGEGDGPPPVHGVFAPDGATDGAR